MKIINYFIPAVLLIAACEQPAKDTPANEDSKTEGTYDAELANELGADDYGMSRYVMAFLYGGKNDNLTTEEATELQKSHLDNISRMADEGKLVVAGPFLDGGELRGIYIFDVESIEEAEELTNSDPAIKRGALRMELLPWYGSASLKATYEIHKTIAKTNP